LLLSVLAGALGLALAYVSFDAIVALAPSDVPRLDQAAIDWRALLFACAVSVATAMAVGLLPAWRDSADDAVHALQHRLRGGIRQRASNRITKVLVAAQIAVAVVLLTGAGLFARSFAALMRLDLGFDPRNVLTFHLTLPESRFVTRENRLALVDAVIDRVRRLPDVVGVGAVYQRPFAHGPIGMDAGVIVEGQPLNADSSSRNPILNWEAATPEYFRAMDIRLLSGRSFNDTDTEKAPRVVIISESLGRRLLPGQDPIGRRILAYVVSADEKHPAWQTIVGVVEDARYREIQTPRYDLYLPYRQALEGVRDFVVRVTRDPAALVPQLRTAVATIDPEITVDGIFTLNQVVGRVLAPWRFSTVVVSVFSILALTLAAAGVMALLAYAVTQRTWEIGVRMALGAQRRQVVGLIVKESLWMSAGGLAAGMLTAWTMRQSVSSMLFGVSPGDHVTFAVVPGLLIAAGLVAAYIPARRAARIDPAVTLRSE
jgi:putative ABC transport system permease protein